MNYYTAVVVDDEVFAAIGMAQKLEATKKVKVVAVFFAALDALDYVVDAPEKVNFIFCDVLMEGIRGTAAVKLFREHVHNVVLFTGNPELATRDDAHLADSTLSKPVDQKKLDELIDKLVSPKVPPTPVKVPNYIDIRSIPDTLDDRDEINELIRIPLADLVYFDRVGNYVHVYIWNKEGNLSPAGRMRTSIATLYKTYQLTNLFLYINASQLVHVKFITDHSTSGVVLNGSWPLKISNKGIHYYTSYLALMGLKAL